MHEITTSTPTVRYRERLAPSLPVLGAAAVCAPMAALVLAPIDGTLALVVGGAIGVALITLLVLVAPVIEINDRELRVGRAHIEHRYLGDPIALTGDQARHARGPGLRRDWWHRFRGGIDGVVTVAVTDPDDPVTTWAFSSRTPDRVAAILARVH